MRLGYRTAVQLLFIALLVLTVSVVAATGYHQARSGVVNLGVSVIDAGMRQIQARGALILETAEDQLALFALTLQDRNWIADREPILRYLWELTHQSPLYQSSFVADRQGNLLQARTHPNAATRVVDQTQNQGEFWTYRDPNFNPLTRITKPPLHDPREQPWFVDTLADPKPQVSEIYRHAGTQEGGITISSPVKDKAGNIVGVAGIDISLNSLNTFLTKITPSEELLLLIVNDAGQIIAFPHGLFTLSQQALSEQIITVADLRQTWIKEAWDLLSDSQQTGTSHTNDVFALSNGYYFLRKQQITSGFNSEWYLLVMVPEHIVLASVNRGLYSSIMLALIMQIIAAYIIFVTATQLTKPLKQMVNNAKMLEELRFEELRPVNSPFNEFIVLDNSIRKMKGSLLAFNRYVPTALVRRLLTEQHSLALGGESRPMIILNTGINAFSSLGRTMSAPEQANYLTRYQSEVFEAIRRNDGSVDKFIDDRIIGFWGAPDANENDIFNACQAAIETKKAIIQLNNGLHRDGFPPMSVRAGLHSDLCVVGNFGSEDRMFYSVIGTAVSASLWLCNLNKLYGTGIIASARVQKQVPRDFVWRRLDRVLMYDKKTVFDIYELVGTIDDPEAIQRESLIDRYEQALALRYEGEDPQGALQAFQDLAEQFPHDVAIELQIRCLTSANSSEISHELL